MKTRMIRKTVFGCLFFVAATAISQEAPVTRAEFEALKARMMQLEKLVQSQKGVIEEQSATIETQNARITEQEAGRKKLSEAVRAPLGNWSDRVALSGVVEVEAGYTKTKSDNDDADLAESDIALATVELGLEARINDWITGNVVLLWEEDDTEPVDLDVGTVLLGNTEEFPLYLELGKTYVPFGPCAARHVHCARLCSDNEPPHESSFITDPVTLELGETRESAARLGGVFGPFDLNVTMFNGDIDEDDNDNHLENAVVALTFAQQWNESLSLACGAAYITNIADSDGFTDRINTTTGENLITDNAPGFNAFASLGLGRVGLLAEYVGATDDFEAGELFAGTEARPQTWNFEASLAVSDALAFALKYETAEDLFEWLPEKRYGAVASYLLHEGKVGSMTLALEYLHGEYDDADDTEEDTITLQLAVEF